MEKLKLEYNIVGVAKESEEDLRAIYDEAGAGVWALALTVTGSRKLAREIAVEVFHRIKLWAHSFDTEMNGVQWISDMCLRLSENCLRDPVVKELPIAKQQVDNASALISDLLFKLDGDRDTLIAAKATLGLGTRELAELTGYYPASVRAEQNRGIARLAEMDEARDKKTLLKTIGRELRTLAPDYWEAALGDKPTAVSHVSHEAMYLSDEEGRFEGGEQERAAVEHREKVRREAKKRRTIVGIIIGAVLLAAAAVAALVVVHVRNKAEQPKEDPAANVQFGNTVDMVKIGDVLYFRGVAGGIYGWDTLAGGDPFLVTEESARELITDGTRLIFRSTERSRLFSIETDGSGLKQLCGRAGTTLAYANGKVYFSASDGIYAMPSTGVGDDAELEAVYIEEVEDAPSRSHMAVTEDGRVIFSGGADKGIYEVTDWNGSGVLSMKYFDEAYYFTLWDGTVLFDSMLAGSIYLYRMNIDTGALTQIGVTETESGEAAGEAVLSYSAAYTVLGDTLYYEGCKSDGGTGKTDIGLYSIAAGASGESAKLLLGLDAEGAHVTEMFTDGERLYCFYSDGLASGERRLVAYDLDDFAESTVVFSGRRG